MKCKKQNLYLTLSNEEQENLEEFFLYIYEVFFKTSKAFFEIDILDFLKKEIAQIEKVENRSSGEKWHLYHLLVFKHQCKFHDLKYMGSVISKLICNIEKLSNNEMIEYLNYINEGLHDKIGELLRVRPKEITRVINQKSIEYPVIEEVLKSFDSIYYIFKLNVEGVEEELRSSNYDCEFLAEDYMGFIINYINRFISFPTDSKREIRRKNVELYINTSLYLDTNLTPYYNLKMADDLVDIVVNSSLRAFEKTKLF